MESIIDIADLTRFNDFLDYELLAPDDNSREEYFEVTLRGKKLKQFREISEWYDIKKYFSPDRTLTKIWLNKCKKSEYDIITHYDYSDNKESLDKFSIMMNTLTWIIVN